MNQTKYEGYFVDKAGRVFSSKKSSTPKQLKPYDTGSGYYQVALTIEGEVKKLYVHRLIAQCYIANNDNKPCVNHINGVRSDNRAENLEWVSYLENTHDERGRNNRYVLSPSKVKDIRESLAGGVAIRKLARDFGVDPQTIRAVRNRKIWSWV